MAYDSSMTKKNSNKGTQVDRKDIEKLGARKDEWRGGRSL